MILHRAGASPECALWKQTALGAGEACSIQHCLDCSCLGALGDQQKGGPGSTFESSEQRAAEAGENAAGGIN